MFNITLQKQNWSATRGPEVSQVQYVKRETLGILFFFYSFRLPLCWPSSFPLFPDVC